jgi:hypothetical protein
LANRLCRLFLKRFGAEAGESRFLLKRADDVDEDERLFLDEALQWLEVYDEPDPGVYDPPPPKYVMVLAAYARQARNWEQFIGTPGDKKPQHLAQRQYRSAWKLALLRAVLACGLDVHYLQIAEWIAEKVPEALPPYCAGNEEKDLTLLVRQDERIRNQFKKDLNKIKSDIRASGGGTPVRG